MVDQITAHQLADKLDNDETFTLIDTRPKDSYEAWHVTGAENVSFDPHDGISDDDLDRVNAIADDRPIVTMCGKGLTSTPFTFELEKRGYDDVAVVKGGMEDWSKVYEVVPIDTHDDDLIILQLQRRAKGCLGYLVGSQSSGEAAVIDVTRQTNEFKVAAEERGLTITHALDTHIHADHISGSPRLADALDVPYHLGEQACERDVEYEYEPLDDGDVIEIGAIEIEVLHAPGHTSEMMNFVVNDEAVLTGDTLFVDSVGRTELQFGDADATRGAELLYDTLHDTLLELPDDLQVLPGHVTVTADGRYENGSPGKPINRQLDDLAQHLDVLQLEKEEFVERLTENAPEKPPNYETVIDINTGKEMIEDEKNATELELGPNNCAA
ncbi:MBL fold metallo-hydrolase [Haladaptatus halobius]|uniref:MBL fold metallo-hydrolase n=1 Tax=Haladaptatus halobius TaxID=2884875 RepID=UPI001D0A5F7F|nr:rhodanese-like domain-containing protein [Haladaptatus halobius]